MKLKRKRTPSYCGYCAQTLKFPTYDSVCTPCRHQATERPGWDFKYPCTAEVKEVKKVEEPAKAVVVTPKPLDPESILYS